MIHDIIKPRHGVGACTIKGLNLVLLLASGGKYSVVSIANKLDVTTKTARRYLVSIEKAGIPLMSQDEHLGIGRSYKVYYLPRNWVIKHFNVHGDDGAMFHNLNCEIEMLKNRLHAIHIAGQSIVELGSDVYASTV